MSYKIEQIEGIGSHYAELLTKAGISNTDELLAKCADNEARARVMASTGIPANQLETWFHQADLMRVSGIGSEFGQLLERAGVQSVKELAVREPENITHLLHRVNEMKHLTRAVPSMKTVSKWISRAQQLEKMRVNGPASQPVAMRTLSEPSLADTTRYPTLTSTPVVNGTSSRPPTPGTSWR